jgi:SRSO17 transposase
VRGLLLDGSASRYSRWRTGWGSIISGCSRSWALRQLAAEFPADTPLQDLIRLGKIRWRIEHDYRELKTGLGLDDYEGRTWKGWHRHVTLVAAAHLVPHDSASDQPKSDRSGLSLYTVLRELQAQLPTWTGHCPPPATNPPPYPPNKHY